MAKCQIVLGDVAGASSALREATALEPHNAALDTERRNLDAVSRLTKELDLAIEKVGHRATDVSCLTQSLTSLPEGRSPSDRCVLRRGGMKTRRLEK